MAETITTSPPLPPMPTAWVYRTIACYLLPMVAVFLPAEKLCLGAQCYTMALWYQYNGRVLLIVVAGMLLLQMLFWLNKQKWPLWPGVVAGLYVTSFSLWKIITLQSQSSFSATLGKKAIQSSVSPMWGLYLLAIGGIILLAVHGWLLRSRPKQRNRAPL